MTILEIENEENPESYLCRRVQGCVNTTGAGWQEERLGRTRVGCGGANGARLDKSLLCWQ